MALNSGAETVAEAGTDEGVISFIGLGGVLTSFDTAVLLCGPLTVVGTAALAS